MAYKVDIMTLFPDTMNALLHESILGRAAKKALLEINCVQIRDYTDNKQFQVDDYPYGGGWGCVLMAQPLKACLDSIMSTSPDRRTRVIYMSPQGAVFNQETAKRLSRDYDHLVLVCGHYEGIDERFIEECVDEELSLGDFVLTGGELAAMAVTDAVCRLVPGVLADEECYTGESHWAGLLEYPQYTRPELWEGRAVPEVLRSGNHAEVERWRRKKSLERTMDKRPDMFERLTLSPEDEALLSEILAERAPKKAVPVFDCRRAAEEDIPVILSIVAEAREFLRQSGVDQWQDGEPPYPDAEVFRDDIAAGECWLFFSDGEPMGVVTLSTRHEACYDGLSGGRWLSGEDAFYAVIHRSAVRAKARGTGLAVEMFSFCEDLARGLGCAGLRIDTHENNRAMRGLLNKLGFVFCGEVTVSVTPGHDPRRLAFEKVF